MEELKDTEYYIKSGDRRKKGYLFHGLGGCGKTSAIVAMALKDRRHIIEIPVGKLNSENIDIIFRIFRKSMDFMVIQMQLLLLKG